MFSTTILFVTLSTIFVNVVAGEASNIVLIRGARYEQLNLAWDMPRILVYCVAGLVALSGVATMIYSVSWTFTAQLLLLTLLGVARTFGVSPDKFAGRFDLVVYIHVTYAVGAVAGTLLVEHTGSPYAPFLLAEFMAVVATLIVRFTHSETSFTLRATPEFRSTRNNFFQLASAALLVNTVSYLDRIVIMPLLGATALGVYYATSALSKSLSLVTNPVGNAFLARIGKVDPQHQGPLFKRSTIVASLAVVVFAFVSYWVSYLGLAFLYPDFYSIGKSILLPVALTAAFASGSDLMRPLIMRFVPGRRFLLFNSGYAFVYVVLIIVLSSFWGLTGFAWASVISRAVLFFIYLIQCAIRGRKK